MRSRFQGRIRYANDLLEGKPEEDYEGEKEQEKPSAFDVSLASLKGVKEERKDR